MGYDAGAVTTREGYRKELREEAKSMKTVNHRIEGDVRIAEDIQLNGMVTGNLTVGSGATLLLNGTVVRKLILEPLSKVALCGTVSGGVENRGGHLEVLGVVRGGILRQAGTTVVHADAVVD